MFPMGVSGPLVSHAMNEDKYARLQNLVRSLPQVSIALSGGLDSRFLVYSCLQAGLRPWQIQVLHASGPHMPARESLQAWRWAMEQGLSPQVVGVHPLLNLPVVAQNSPERCYACKKYVFSRFQGLAFGTLCDGSNSSDKNQHRPGKKALDELGIFSPLAEVGLEKSEIYALAEKIGLDNPRQKARPCLLTRFDYNVSLSIEKLQLLERLETHVEEALFAVPQNPEESEGPQDWDFRVRLLGTQPELHLVGKNSSQSLYCASTQNEWLDKWLDKLNGTLSRQGLPSLSLRLMPTMSGYFDRGKIFHDHT